MFSEGIIYQYGGKNYGQLIFEPEGGVGCRAGILLPLQIQKRLPLKRSLLFFSNLLILFSALGFLSLAGPIFVGELSYRFRKPEPEIRLSFGDILGSQSIEASYPAPDPNFSIIIPKISAKAKVFPDVSPADQNEYLPILKQGVAHAKGTAFPGQRGNVYLFAHSTDISANIARYNAVFYNLEKLEEGDQIIIYFADRIHLYRVTEKKIVPASDVSVLEPQNNEEILILQTCWPPGTTIDRLLIFAKKA